MPPANVKTKSPIPKRLREARMRSGLSQASLGVKAGLDPSVASTRVNQYEQGVHNPGYPTVLHFAAVLDVPVPYFYCQDDRMAQMILMMKSLTDEDVASLEEWFAARQA